MVVKARSEEAALKTVYETKGKMVQLAPGRYALVKASEEDKILVIFKYIPILREKVYIGKDLLRTINGYLNAKPEDEFQPEANMTSVTARFPNGIEMDVECCRGQDEPSWTEAVLFENGCEVGCTEPGEKFEGEWELEYKGIRYIAKVLAVE